MATKVNATTEISTMKTATYGKELMAEIIKLQEGKEEPEREGGSASA